MLGLFPYYPIGSGLKHWGDTQSDSAIVAVVDQIGVLINSVPGFRIDHMPYGGVKDSGLGREGIRYAMEDMSEPRILVY